MPAYKDLANAIRALSMDAVERAKSGHPGMPMGMATIAEVLWNDFLHHNPSDPKWANRDRFVVSNGHGSMLLYSLLHLSGYDLSIEDIKNFRQLHSKTPGHPEYRITPGVETTTGPLGQGLANAVGMAMAEKLLAAQFNKDSLDIINHNTYAFVGDGCLMEGISHEVCSFAGTQELNKLIVFWDDNGISIDGEIKNWCKDDVAKRFLAYGWNVITNIDGNDRKSIYDAISDAKKSNSKPTLICCQTVIGYGSPNFSGKAKSHGSPLGEQECKETKKHLGWAYEPFIIPDEIYQAWDAKEKGRKLQIEWDKLFARYNDDYPELATELNRRIVGELPKNISEKYNDFIQKTQLASKSIATRKASLACLDFMTPMLSELLGGSADLTGSNLTLSNSSTAITAENIHGDYLHYGIREFGMAAIMNGISLHGGFVPFGGTFLVFSDYARNAIRMSALMEQRVIYVLTHDSIGLGEDGPTHQPIEHLCMLRATPNLNVWRPCDAVETAVAWHCAIKETSTPSVLALTRQTIAANQRDTKQLEGIKKGAYILWQEVADEKIDCIIMSTGSEIELAISAAEILSTQKINARVVSMPCIEKFLQQSSSYQEFILPSHIIARVAVEAGASQCWYRFVGLSGLTICIDRFGESAPAGEIYKVLGITKEAIIAAVKKIIK